MCLDFTVVTEDIEHSLAPSSHRKSQQTGRNPDTTARKQPFEKSEEFITIDDAMWCTTLYQRHES
jgi:hypothetical protein